MSEIDLDELERLAKAATPGPWKANGPDVDMVPWVPGERPLRCAIVFQSVPLTQETLPEDVADAAYIAAVSPSAVLALVESVRCWRGQAAAMGRKAIEAEARVAALERERDAALTVADVAEKLLEEVMDRVLGHDDPEPLGPYGDLGQAGGS